MVKNPAGFNEILRLLGTNRSDKYVLVAINDLIADGRDVSWLWDVDFEDLVADPNLKKIRVSGIRAVDMALRLKYAGLTTEPEIETDLETALEASIEEVPKGDTLYILPTYTPMITLKKILARRGYSTQFWED